jgi:hypothetical protein
MHKNAYNMWESLRKKFKAEADDDLVGLIGDFVTSRRVSNKEDSDGDWISRLEIMSKEMSAIHSKNKKRDQEIIAHMFAHLPKLYENTVETIHYATMARSTYWKKSRRVSL